MRMYILSEDCWNYFSVNVSLKLEVLIEPQRLCEGNGFNY